MVQRIMKRKIIKVFYCVIVLNLILFFFLYKCNTDEVGVKDSIIYLLGSYVVYWLLNLYIVFLKKYKQILNYSTLILTGTFVSIFTLIALILNLRNDLILFLPMMYVVSMLCTFMNWIIAERKENKKQEEN